MLVLDWESKGLGEASAKAKMGRGEHEERERKTLKCVVSFYD